MVPHEIFVEMCAIFVAGELSAEERQRLEAHLQVCATCRKALEQFKLCPRAAIPDAASAISNRLREFDSSVPIERAEARFFARFDEDGGFGGSTASSSPTEVVHRLHSWDVPPPNDVGWGQLWMPFVTVILLALALGIASYRTGINKGTETALHQQHEEGGTALTVQLGNARRESEQLQEQVAEREREITELKKQTQELSASIRQRAITTAENQKRTDSDFSGMLAKLQQLQEHLDAAEQTHSQLVTHAGELEAKADELSRRLRESDLTVAQQGRQLEIQAGTIDQQRDLLAHDRDVRELIGARDLYVAEVYDVAGTGETNKPYGRIFYTKGKSLIFYAYDLDQAQGLQSASTFQAWGQRGRDRQGIRNLGIFYEDNAANKRWVLKSNNPETLEQIDAVFVTVEPDAHSHRPKGKQVLFAYLRINSNHP